MGGVGTRRWAKFSKYLARKDYKVHVVTLQYPFHDENSWAADVTDPRIIVHRLPCHVPLWMIKRENRMFLETWGSMIFKRIFRSSAIDIADGWEKFCVPYALNLIKQENIRNVIVTGPPSSLHFAGALLKKENPGIHLIQDYRDPWNTDRDYQLGQGLKSTMAKERSLRMEKEALQAADRVVVVTRDMEKQLKELHPSITDRVSTIHNGFDPDETMRNHSNPAPTFSLLYSGILGTDRALRPRALELLANAIDSLNDAFIRENLTIHVTSDIDLDFFSFSPIFETIKKNFRFHPFINPSRIPSLVHEHTYCLSINAEVDSHAFGSKVFDYMAQGKKIFLISNEGDLSDVLKSKGLFTATYDLESVKQQLIRLKEDFLAGGYKTPLDYSEFELPRLVERFETVLI